MIHFVLCPPHIRTGGPEALCQLANGLSFIGLEAYLVYWPITPGAEPDPDYRYLTHLRVLNERPWDSKQARIIFPEIWPDVAEQFPIADKWMWWLGSGGGNPVIKHHLAQCHYTKEILATRGIPNVPILSDYISPAHFGW